MGVNCFCVERRRVAAGAGRSPEHAQDEQVSTGRAVRPYFRFSINPVNHRLGPDTVVPCRAVPLVTTVAARSRGVTARSTRRWSARGMPWRRKAGRCTTSGRGSRRPPSPRSTSSAAAVAPSEGMHAAHRHRQCAPTSDHTRFSQYSCSICECHAAIRFWSMLAFGSSSNI